MSWESWLAPFCARLSARPCARFPARPAGALFPGLLRSVGGRGTLGPTCCACRGGRREGGVSPGRPSPPRAAGPRSRAPSGSGGWEPPWAPVGFGSPVPCARPPPRGPVAPGSGSSLRPLFSKPFRPLRSSGVVEALAGRPEAAPPAPSAVRRGLSVAPVLLGCWGGLLPPRPSARKVAHTTLSGGSLGSCVDEERS